MEPGVAQAVSRAAQGSLSRASALANRWEADSRIRAQIAAALSGQEPAAVPPHERQELARWCEQTIEVLREAALSATPQLDRDRCIGAALEAIAWAESLKEQFVSPRLVATLLRESWLELAR